LLHLGIIGTGRMAVRLADLAAKSGHRVTLGSRSLDRAAKIAGQLSADGRIRGGSYHDAVACDIVLPSVFIRDGAFEQLTPFAAAVEGKIVVDILNPFNDRYDDFLLDWNTSAAEQLQKIWPGARIVSTFKWPFWEAFENSEFDGGPLDIIYTGNDAEAKRVVLELFSASPWRFLDGGDLTAARFTERMTLFAARLAMTYGYLPRVGWRLLGDPWIPGERDAYKHIVERWNRP
jgi:predicted dinucleotide-binding enzyme